MSSISQIASEEDQNILSVSQISALIQNTLTSEFSGVRIKGEISGLKLHTSGHAYFNLKDENSVINAVCWRGTVSKLKIKLEEGLEVIVYGNINTYPARSNYQIVCNDIKVAGLGALMALLEERKKKLMAEGLFAPERKRQLPYMPSVIGVITSPTGAVIKDILHRISERFGVHVLLYPVAVQGEGAAEQIAEGIEFFNKLEDGSWKLEVDNGDNSLQTSNFKLQTNIPAPQVLIVARGGGSIEDLWAFNEEIVVRAAANSNIPLISAVGHETDTTLIDFASDRRAPTPTAAAEMAVPVKADIISYIMDLKARGFSSITRTMESLNNLLKARASALISPKQMLMNMAQRLDDISERLNSVINFSIKNSESRLKNTSSQLLALSSQLLKLNSNKIENYKQLLESYNYKNVMKRGYALVKKVSAELVKSSTQLNAGDLVEIEFHDGSKKAVVDGSDNKPSLRAKRSNPEKPTKKTIDQGTLF
jgi:exodeoxyribonuclease VII large subunit